MNEPESNALTGKLYLGDWLIDVSRNSLVNQVSQEQLAIEPKVMLLLDILARANGDVVFRETLIQRLWPTTIVGEDTLSRTVSRLRKALKDIGIVDAPVQTIPKKGYALTVSVTEGQANKTNSLWSGKIVSAIAIVLAILFGGLAFYFSDSSVVEPENELLSRAEDYYMNFNYQDNEAAISLYQKVLATDPDNSVAQAGLANSLVQQLVRWPKHHKLDQNEAPSISLALSSGQLEGPEARAMLDRAQAFAERSVRLSPNNAQALKALGFVYSAQNQLDRATQMYQRAIANADNEWRSMINLGEIYLIRKQPKDAVTQFEAAYHAMQSQYQLEAQHVGPWQPEVGVVVAQLHTQLGRTDKAETWYRKVLSLSPFQPEATQGLIAILRNTKREIQALEVCERYQSKFAQLTVCDFGNQE